MRLDVPQYQNLVEVKTTSGRGFTPEEVAARCADRIISIADSAPPELAEQARAFRARLDILIAYYMREAIASDRTTVYNTICDAGHPELANMIRRL